MTQSAPSLRIGLPVYNGGAQLAGAIEALLAQTRTDFELLISDNASTDETEPLCRDYARRDERIRYVRQKENLGAARNFGFVLEGATTPLFMWAACDDLWLPEYVERNVEVLETRPDCVCSVSQVEFVDADGTKVEFVGPPDRPHRLEGGTFPLEGEPGHNLIAYLEAPQCNTRFYGVHRTAVIQRCFSADEHYLASDWVIMARTLHFGKHHEVPEVLLRRGAGGASSDVTRLILETNPSWLSRRWLPMWPMTRRVLFERHMPVPWRSPRRLGKLVRILWQKNLLEHRHHRSQLKLRT